MTTDPNDSAFASSGTLDGAGNFHYGSSGLTKREYFAAMAMQGCLGNSALVQGISFTAKEQGHSVQQTIALVSLEHADALIEALNKETK